MLVGYPVPTAATIDADGIQLSWPRWCAAARYSGTQIGWADVRDADPTPLSGYAEIRLRNGRTVFLPGTVRQQIEESLPANGVPKVVRPPIWSWLLEPFLDTDYNAVRDDVEQRLAEWGFDSAEVRAIRRRVCVPMGLLLWLTWEWVAWDQVDLLAARFSFHIPPGVALWSSYRRFRRWTDDIADRGHGQSEG